MVRPVSLICCGPLQIREAAVELLVEIKCIKHRLNGSFNDNSLCANTM